MATGLPLSCEAVFERGVRYSLVVKILLGGGSLSGSPRWTDSGLEILLSEGGDVELGARTSEHIIVFVFDPLSLLLSLSLYCALYYSYCHSFIACICALH